MAWHLWGNNWLPEPMMTWLTDRYLHHHAWMSLTHRHTEELNEILYLVIFKQTSVIDGWNISCKLALRWMPMDLTDDKSALIQVMAWCSQATSHYLSQHWPRSMLPYGVTRPHWLNHEDPLTHCGPVTPYDDIYQVNIGLHGLRYQ